MARLSDSLAMTAYVNAQSRVTSEHGEASGYLCTRCGERAACFTLDHRAPDAIWDHKGRRYSNDPHWYFPLCNKCDDAYKCMSGNSGPVFRRVSVFEDLRLSGCDWFTELFALDETARTSPAVAYSRYLQWGDGVGMAEVWSKTAFYQHVMERGITRKRTNRGSVFIGVTLRTGN